jgi:hypothetical protein
MRRSILFCILGILVAAPGMSQTKQPFIKIGNCEITVGMSADKLLALLRQDYTLTPLHDDTPVREWFVSAGKNTETLTLGSIYVKGNIVVGVDHLLLDREVDTSQDMFDALFAASSKVSDEGRNTCVVTRWASYMPAPTSLSKAVVYLNCGTYRISLLRNEFKTSDGTAHASYLAREELGTTD